MNAIKIYKADGTLKYTFLPTEAENTDGVISSQNCYVASDDTGAEMEGGSCDFEFYSDKALSFEKGDKIKYYVGDTLFAVFFLETSEKTAINKYSVSGIDSIAMLENSCYYGVFLDEAPFKKYLNDNLSENLNIPVSIDTALESLKITASYPSGYNTQNTSDISVQQDSANAPSQQTSLRDLLQQMAFGYGIRFETLKTDGIKILNDPITYTVKKTYTAHELFSDIEITEKENDIGTVNLYKQYMNTDNTKTHTVKGYFPINGYEKTKIDPFTQNPVLDKTYYADGTTQQPNNELTNNFIPKNAKGISAIVTLDSDVAETDTFPDGKVTTAHYFTSVQNYDGSFTYQIDEQKLQEVKDYLARYVSAPAEPTYTDPDTGTEYALGNIGWRETFLPDIEGVLPYTVELQSTVIYDKNKSKNNVILPFFNDNTASRVDTYFGRTHEVSFKVKYGGEMLGDIVLLPEIYGESLYCAIKTMDFSFSVNTAFCSIVGDVLSDEEVKKLSGINKYGMFKYGTEKYS